MKLCMLRLREVISPKGTQGVLWNVIAVGFFLGPLRFSGKQM